MEKTALKNLRIDADSMSVQQLRTELLAGHLDMLEGNVQDAKSAFEIFRESHQ